MDIKDIIANTSDGILVLSSNGTIEYYNDAFSEILDIVLSDGEKYIDIMNRSMDERNDVFHQVIIDSIYNEGQIIKVQAPFYRGDNLKLSLKVIAKKNADSIVFTITDVTDLEEAKIQHKDSALITASTVSFLCIWVYITKVWTEIIDRDNSIQFVLTYIMLLLGGILAIVCIRNSNLSVHDMGLRIDNKKTLIIDTILSIFFVITACFIKFILLSIKPGIFKTDNFLDWSIFTNTAIILYPISVVGQEILARGYIQQSFKIVFKGKHQKMYSLIVSSLFFGALHIHKNFGYMIVTPIFMFCCGLIYEKQKSIWGICILHYVLLITCKLLGFF